MPLLRSTASSCSGDGVQPLVCCAFAHTKTATTTVCTPLAGVFSSAVSSTLEGMEEVSTCPSAK